MLTIICEAEGCSEAAAHQIAETRLCTEHSLRLVAVGAKRYSEWLQLKNGLQMRAEPKP